MKINKNKLTAFTLAELLVIFFIIGVIVAATASITKAQIDFAKKYQYYAALSNLQSAAKEILADGYDADPSVETSNIVKLLPDKGNFSNSGVQPDGLSDGICQRVANLINTLGDPVCTEIVADPTEPFTLDDTNKPNFIATNGMRFFNFGVANVTPGADDETSYFIVYVDIDGPRGDGNFVPDANGNADVMAFKVYRSGKIVPTKDSPGGNLKKYMTASVRYVGSDTKYVLVDTGVPYLEAACNAGELTDAADCPTGASLKDPCSVTEPLPEGKYTCEVVINRP